MEPNPQTAATEHQKLCVGCGYDLNGLDPAGACPECGVPISRTDLGSGFGRANRRWLMQVELGAWLWVGVGVLRGCIPLVTMLLEQVLRPTASFYVATGVIRTLDIPLTVAAMWLVTVREPGPQRADSPTYPRSLARWLYVAGSGLFLVERWLPWEAVSIGLLHPVYVRYVVVACLQTAGVVLTLLVLRAYALRHEDVRAGRLLRVVAPFVGITGLAGPVLLLLDFIPDPGTWVLPGIIVVGLVVAVGAIMAVTRFAWGLRRVRMAARISGTGQRRMRREMMAIGASLLVGGLAGWFLCQLVDVQVRRAPHSELMKSVAGMDWIFWQVGIVLGVILLRHRLVVLYRMYRRSRQRA